MRRKKSEKDKQSHLLLGGVIRESLSRAYSTERPRELTNAARTTFVVRRSSLPRVAARCVQLELDLWTPIGKQNELKHHALSYCPVFAFSHHLTARKQRQSVEARWSFAKTFFSSTWGRRDDRCAQSARMQRVTHCIHSPLGNPSPHAPAFPFISFASSFLLVRRRRRREIRARVSATSGSHRSLWAPMWCRRAHRGRDSL